MDSPPLDNQTDFIAHPQVLLDRDGEKLVTIVKATWELPRGSDTLALSAKQRGIRPGDIPWGLPGESSPMLPEELLVRKPGTDVVVVARAYPPGGRPTEQWDVSVRVGPVGKVLRVFGLRVWQAGGQGISAPRPITELELRYEHAWGGLQMDDAGNVAEEARNPMGRGVVLDRSTLTHQPAPQIEDPFDLIVSAETEHAPAGVGPIPRHWRPRRDYLGTYDERWLDERAPLPPLDEDDRAYNVASPGLTAPTPLVGGEEVAVTGMQPGGGAVGFRLPRVGIEIGFEREGQEPLRLTPHLDTVVIDQLWGAAVGWPTVEMVWRAAVPAPRSMKDVRLTVRERELR